MELQPGDNLQGALDALAPGAVLHLGAGAYLVEDPLRLDRGVRLVGAGAARSRIVRRRTPHAHIVTAHPPAGETLVLEDLAIAWADDGPDRPGEYLFQSDVLVVAGGRVELRRCRLAGSVREHERSNDMYGGSGLRMAGNGHVRADACEIVYHGGHGVAASERSALVLENCWVTDNRGIGLWAAGETVVETQMTTFAANGQFGIAADDSTALTLVEALVQTNRRGGVRFATTGAGRLARCTIEANGGRGVDVAAGSLAIEGGAIRRNASDGVAVAAGGQVSAAEIVIEENRGFGVAEAVKGAVTLEGAAVYKNTRGEIGSP